jgi:hypothetical protein
MNLVKSLCHLVMWTPVIKATVGRYNEEQVRQMYQELVIPPKGSANEEQEPLTETIQR